MRKGKEIRTRRVGSLRLKQCGKRRMEANGWSVDGIMRSMILLNRQDHPIVRGRFFVVGLKTRELFETDHVSNNPVESIVDTVSVLSPSEWESLSEEEQNRQFFCEFIYSVKTTYIHPIYGK